MTIFICPRCWIELDRTDSERFDDIMYSLEIGYAASIDVLGSFGFAQDEQA